MKIETENVATRRAASPNQKRAGASDTSCIGVVVLNYNDYASSITCVHSLLGCMPKPGRIIVVDNASGNESAAKLVEEFRGLDDVDVVVSPVNGGYSAGNNIGISKLQSLGFEHVLIATSDTEVISKNLFRRLEETIGRGAGIVSPQILGPDGPENPSIDRLSLKYIVDLAWLQCGMPGLGLRRWMSRTLRSIFAIGNKRTPVEPSAAQQSRDAVRQVYKVHGAFLCLTSSFLSNVGKLDESIFMFGEEDLLAWECLNSKRPQMLVEDAYVAHARDSSVNKTWGREAQAFVDRQQKASCAVLRRKIRLSTLIKKWIGEWWLRITS